MTNVKCSWYTMKPITASSFYMDDGIVVPRGASGGGMMTQDVYERRVV